MHCTWFRSIKKMLEASGERFLDAHVLFQPHPILVWCSVAQYISFGLDMHYNFILLEP
jgi:hypothetical protein